MLPLERKEPGSDRSDGCDSARGKAHVLYVADAFAVMAKIHEILTW